MSIVRKKIKITVEIIQVNKLIHNIIVIIIQIPT